MSSDTNKPEANPSGAHAGIDAAKRADRPAVVVVEADPKTVQFRTTSLNRRAPRP